MIISKELLSEVLSLKEDIKMIKISDANESEYLYQLSGARLFTVNIYEVAHKNLKEWAYKKGFILMSGKINNEYYCEYGTIEYYKNNGYLKEFKKADTEPNAIFKVCEFIKDNKCL